MKRRGLFALPIMLALPRQAYSQPREPPTWRPDWAETLPTGVPNGTIGVLAHLPELKAQFCVVEVWIVNNTETTIRSAIAQVEVFFGEQSVVANFVVQLSDPGRIREAQIHLPRGCAVVPSKVVLRQIQLCTTAASTFPRRACGAPWVSFMPDIGRRNFRPIRLEIAPDYDR